MRIANFRSFGKALVVAGAIALAACTPDAAEQVAEPIAAEAAATNTHPVSGLEVIPVTISTASGTHVVQAEVAASRQEQSRGLMFRTEMGADEGMIFPYEAPQMMGFWMRNTLIPLDLIFIDENHTVINIERGEPYNEISIESDREAIAVLELNAGRSEELGIQPGDSIAW